MKNSIKMVCLALVLMLGSNVFAQGHKGHKGQRDSAWVKISERLQLSNDQKTKLKEISKQNKEEMKALRESLKTASKEEKKKALLAQLQKNDARVNAILDEKQQAEYKKLKEEKRAAMKKRKLDHKQAKPQKGEPEEDILEESIL